MIWLVIDLITDLYEESFFDYEYLRNEFHVLRFIEV